MTLRRKEIVGLLGPNGAGKTTTFYMIIGLTRPNEGRVYLDGEDITEAPMYLRARKGINYLAQEPSVFRRLTVEQNLLAIMENIKIPSHEIKERTIRLLSELNISHLAKQRASSL
ncbi:MAG: ATP-binding cassette domain-containing protein, partial [Deltaproteobacteria bacterium]